MKINTKQFKTKNFKGVVSLLAGNTISKLILTIGGMFLAKYYGPESYGVYTVFLSYVMIIPVLASFRLDNIMILQRGSTEVRNLFSGIIWISLLITIFLMIILGLVKSIDIFQIEMSYFVLALCGLASVLTAWNNAQNALFTKFKLFNHMSAAFIISAVFAIIFQVIFYFMDYQENGLIYGWIIGLIASFIYNAQVTRDRLARINIPLFKRSVKEHFEVVKFTYPSDSINTIANNILPILAIGYFTSIEIGVFGIASKIMITPLILLSNSISRVYFQKSVTLYNHNKQQLTKLTYRVISMNLGVNLLFVLLINTIGIYLFDLFLNENWDYLQDYILALSFWILARSVLHPIASIIVIIKKNSYSLIFNIYLLLVNILAVYLGVLKNDFLFCIWIFSILSGAGYIVLVLTVLFNLRKDVRS